MWRISAVLSSLASVVFLLASYAHAATYPHFVLDLSKSSISVSPSSYCRDGNCGLKARFTQTGTKTLSFSSVGQTIRLDDLIQWRISESGGGPQNVSVKLAFTSPGSATARASGKSLTWSTLNFKSSGALLWWTGAQSSNFEQGSQLSMWMGKSISLIGKKKSESDVFISAKKLVPLEAPAAAAVPALIPALLVALVGLGLMGRRQSRRLGGRRDPSLV